MCMGILSACISLYHVHAWCPWCPEEGIEFPQYWSYGWLQVAMWVLEIKLESSKAQPGLLTTEPSL